MSDEKQPQPYSEERGTYRSCRYCGKQFVVLVKVWKDGRRGLNRQCTCSEACAAFHAKRKSPRSWQPEEVYLLRSMAQTLNFDRLLKQYSEASRALGREYRSPLSIVRKLISLGLNDRPGLDFYNLTQVAQLLGVYHTRVHAWADKGYIRSRRVGAGRFLFHEEVARLIRVRPYLFRDVEVERLVYFLGSLSEAEQLMAECQSHPTYRIRPVVRVSDGARFCSIKAAANAVGRSERRIRNALETGERCAGSHWCTQEEFDAGIFRWLRVDRSQPSEGPVRPGAVLPGDVDRSEVALQRTTRKCGTEPARGTDDLAVAHRSGIGRQSGAGTGDSSHPRTEGTADFSQLTVSPVKIPGSDGGKRVRTDRYAKGPSRLCRPGMRVRQLSTTVKENGDHIRVGTVIGQPYRAMPGNRYYVRVQWDRVPKPIDIYISHLVRIDDRGQEIPWSAPWSEGGAVSA